jgi:hypothetical protein
MSWGAWGDLESAIRASKRQCIFADGTMTGVAILLTRGRSVSQNMFLFLQVHQVGQRLGQRFANPQLQNRL